MVVAIWKSQESALGVAADQAACVRAASCLPAHFIHSWLYHVLSVHMNRVGKSILSHRAAFNIRPLSWRTLAKLLEFLATTSIGPIT